MLLARTRVELEDWDGVVLSFNAFWRRQPDRYFVVTASPLAIEALVAQGELQDAFELAQDVNRFVVDFAVDEGFESGMSSGLLAWTAELCGKFSEAEKAFTAAIEVGESLGRSHVGRSRARFFLNNKDGAASDALAAFHYGGGLDEASADVLVAVIYAYESVVALADGFSDLFDLCSRCLKRAKYGYLAFPTNADAVWEYAAAVGALRKRGLTQILDGEAECRAVAQAVKGLRPKDQALVTNGYWTDWLIEYLK